MTPDMMADAFTEWVSGQGLLAGSDEQRVRELAAAFMAGGMHMVRAGARVATHRERLGRVAAGERVTVDHGLPAPVVVQFTDRAAGQAVWPSWMESGGPEGVAAVMPQDCGDLVALVVGGRR
jgi:hypothetical protein